MLKRIVSGGQTGVDQAALDAAIACNIPHGGWCPKGRIAENGLIPERFTLRETDSSDQKFNWQDVGIYKGQILMVRKISSKLPR